MFKSNKGFTLVELIVVIAILAILAGVAVPAYTGYIEKAESAADITKLDAVKTAVQAAYATQEQPTEIIVTEGTGDAADSITVNGSPMATDVKKDFMLYYDGDASAAFSIELDTGDKATWNGSSWTIE